MWVGTQETYIFNATGARRAESGEYVEAVEHRPSTDNKAVAINRNDVFETAYADKDR